ncbi:hypothetical protein BB14905_20885 [Bacillus sp. B14905]|nr:hypothetical protein BB14905_20885 [Bacillus sp. B14905]
MVEGDGFEPPNPKERIYSPPRLATSLPLQGNNGAGDRSRTHDLLITSQLLYQLSYTGNKKITVPTGIEPAISCVTGRHVNRYTTGPKWWRMTGSNRRPPACKAGALPTELILHKK